jgi:hypothetical protein
MSKDSMHAMTAANIYSRDASRCAFKVYKCPRKPPSAMRWISRPQARTPPRSTRPSGLSTSSPNDGRGDRGGATLHSKRNAIR